MQNNNWKTSTLHRAEILTHFADVFLNGGLWVEMVTFFSDDLFDIFRTIKNDVFDTALNGSINGIQTLKQVINIKIHVY